MRRTLKYPPATRGCSVCKKKKPWTEFYPRKVAEDGTVETTESRCKACDKKLAAQRVRAKIDRIRQGVGPINEEVWKAERRAIDTAYRRRLGAKARNANTAPPTADPDFDKVPIGPFRDWLQRKMDEEFDGAANAIAPILGVDEARIRVWLGDKAQSRSDFMTKISVGTVDRALCSAHEPEKLRELYPEWYEQPYRPWADVRPEDRTQSYWNAYRRHMHALERGEDPVWSWTPSRAA